MNLLGGCVGMQPRLSAPNQYSRARLYLPLDRTTHKRSSSPSMYASR